MGIKHWLNPKVLELLEDVIPLQGSYMVFIGGKCFKYTMYFGKEEGTLSCSNGNNTDSSNFSYHEEEAPLEFAFYNSLKFRAAQQRAIKATICPYKTDCTLKHFGEFETLYREEKN